VNGDLVWWASRSPARIAELRDRLFEEAIPDFERRRLIMVVLTAYRRSNAPAEQGAQFARDVAHYVKESRDLGVVIQSAAVIHCFAAEELGSVVRTRIESEPAGQLKNWLGAQWIDKP